MANNIKPLKAIIKSGRLSSVSYYATGDVIPIECGGTSADNPVDALTNLGAAPLNHTHAGDGSSATRVHEESPKGNYDKTNTDYRTVQPFISSTVELFLNGLRQRSGIDNDFLLISPNIIRMNDSPWQGDLLTVSYDIQTTSP